MKAEEMGKFICEVRKEKHMTQADLARTLHVTSQAISKWERGLGFPDIGTLQPLSEALDVSLEELMNAARHAPADDVFSPEEAVQNIISIAVLEMADKRKLRVLIAEIILCVCGTVSLLYYALSFYATYSFLYTIISVYWNRSDVTVEMRKTPPLLGYSSVFIGLGCFSAAVILMIIQFHGLRRLIKRAEN